MSNAIKKEQPYPQASKGGVMEFNPIVTNGAVGAIVSFASENTLPNGKHIDIPPTKVPPSTGKLRVNYPSERETA